MVIFFSIIYPVHENKSDVSEQTNKKKSRKKIKLQNCIKTQHKKRKK